jgi:N-acetylglucosamine-6-phosphate deacetylase
MSQLGNREPGVVGAALEDSGSWCGIIVDGVHVDPVVLRLALRCKPADRFMLVSDAMPNVGADLSEFTLAGKRIVVQDGKLLDESGTLAGASLHMAGAVANAIKLLGVDLARAARMASANPAAFLGLGDLGRIEPGYRASLVLADDRLNVLESWIDGRSM